LALFPPGTDLDQYISAKIQDKLTPLQKKLEAAIVYLREEAEYNRKPNMLISGLEKDPKEDQKSLTTVVLALFNQQLFKQERDKFQLKPKHLSNIHRLGDQKPREKAPPTVIIRFVNQIIRNRVWNARSKFKDLNQERAKEKEKGGKFPILLHNHHEKIKNKMCKYLTLIRSSLAKEKSLPPNTFKINSQILNPTILIDGQNYSVCTLPQAILQLKDKSGREIGHFQCDFGK